MRMLGTALNPLSFAILVLYIRGIFLLALKSAIHFPNIDPSETGIIF